MKNYTVTRIRTDSIEVQAADEADAREIAANTGDWDYSLTEYELEEFPNEPA